MKTSQAVNNTVRAMISAGKKLLVSLGVLIASFALIRVNGWFALASLITFILAIMYSMDFAGELSEIESPTVFQRFLRLLMSVPMALFALTTTLVGLSIAAWVFTTPLLRGFRSTREASLPSGSLRS